MTLIPQRCLVVTKNLELIQQALAAASDD